MADPRIEKLADILVHHSIGVQAGEKILIVGSDKTAPLIKEVYRKVLQCGALPITQISIAELEKIFYDEATDEVLQNIEATDFLYRHVDGYIRILGSDNTKELSSVDGARIALRRKASAPLMQHLMSGGVRWVLTMFPTQSQAQEADMSLEEYENFVYGATNVDYEALKDSMLGAAEVFNKGSKVRIVANETDLTIDIEGREAVLCWGKRNVPDGEFYFTPNYLKTEGHIYYEWPTLFNGQEISGIRLRFEAGKIVDFSAEKGQPYLEAALNTDEGSRFLGELGIGTNFGLQSPTKDILFDEKIGGSVHLAVGRAYEEGGNVSAIHWDMVKGLKNGGEIYVDGVLVQKDGKWVF